MENKYDEIFKTLAVLRESIDSAGAVLTDKIRAAIMARLGFKLYQKKPMLVFSLLSTRDFEFTITDGQTLSGKSGDYMIASANDGDDFLYHDEWAIDGKIYANSYSESGVALDTLVASFRGKSSGNDLYYREMTSTGWIPTYKTAQTWALDIDETITVPALEGDCIAVAGEVLTVGVSYEPYKQTADKFYSLHTPV